MNCYSVTDSSGPALRLWQLLALITAFGLMAACGSTKKEEKPGTSVLQTRSGETGIQVTEGEQDGIQVIRITTTFRGKESIIVLAVDNPVYEVDIPLSISQQQPALAAGGTAGVAGGAAGGGGGAGGFQDLLIAQYLEKSQVAMLDGIYNEALRQVNLVLMVRPDHVPAHKMKGSIYYAMGNLELANQEWEQVLALDPSNQEVRDFQDFLKNRQGAPQPSLPGGQPGAGPSPPASNPGAAQ